jgi:hypothetical protein
MCYFVIFRSNQKNFGGFIKKRPNISSCALSNLKKWLIVLNHLVSTIGFDYFDHVHTLYKNYEIIILAFESMLMIGTFYLKGRWKV